MNEAVFAREWEQIRVEAKGWWGQLTEEELAGVAGVFDRLMLLLQLRCGFTRFRAEAEFNRHMAERGRA